METTFDYLCHIAGSYAAYVVLEDLGVDPHTRQIGKSGALSRRALERRSFKNFRSVHDQVFRNG